jgi:formylglycine-generating enzyme required for sulfatase activity
MVGNAGGGNARMFKLDVTEVTVSAYAACVAAGTCTEPDTGGKCNWRVTGKEQHPINCVSWMQANAYCQEQGKRLPTGQEWQFAASNGGRTQYPWGDSSPDLIRAKWGSPDGTSPVGTHPAGATQSGLQDLSGNVFEWTAERGEIRGGSWNYAYEEYLRASYRYRVDATDRSGSIGFRCAQ